MAIWPPLITKLHETQPGKLPLDDAEFRLARNSLNHLRNERIARRRIHRCRGCRAAQTHPGQTAVVVVRMIQCQLNWKARTSVRAFAMSKTQHQKENHHKTAQTTGGMPLTPNEFWGHHRPRPAARRPEQRTGNVGRAVCGTGATAGAETVCWQDLQYAYMDLACMRKLFGAAVLINGGSSDDRFLDFTAWLVMQGKTVYESAFGRPGQPGTVRSSL